MAMTGGCYCGALRFEAEGPAVFKGACHCRECQHISGGGANVFMGLPAKGFRYTKGAPKTFTRKDLDAPVTREFCGECGAPTLSRIPSNPDLVIVKVGAFDDPSVYDGPQIAIWMDEARPYHLVAEGVAKFPRLPG